MNPSEAPSPAVLGEAPVARLLVFSRLPAPGLAKTRLAAVLGPEAAAALAAAFLQDEVEAFRRLPGIAVAVAFTPADAALRMAALLADLPGVELVPQGEGELGTRLLRAFAENAQEGRPVVVIGSDSPDLPPELVREAADLLCAGSCEVVLGPAGDGGYTLIGARRPHPELFQGIAWSTSAVLGETLARARAAGLRVHLLPAWDDVDTVDDLHRLRERLAAAPRHVAPRTRALIAQGPVAET